MPKDEGEQEDRSNGFARRFKERWGKVKDTEICGNCSREIPPGADRCPSCGTALRSTKPSVKDPSADFDILLDDVTIVDDDKRKRTGTEKVDLISKPKDKLAILKERLMEKRKETPKEDMFGVHFTDETRKARTKDLQKDEEALKQKLVEGMEEAIQKGSILEHLQDNLRTSSEAVERDRRLTKIRILREMSGKDYAGFENQVSNIYRQLREDNIFDAENSHMKLKLAMRSKRATDMLLVYRAKALESKVQKVGTEVAMRESLKITKERVVKEMAMVSKDELPELRARVQRALDDDLPLEAEEHLLKLKLELQARADWEEFQKEREGRIEAQMKGEAPSPPLVVYKHEAAKEAVPETIAIQELAPVGEEEPYPELEEVQEIAPLEDIETSLEEIKDEIGSIPEVEEVQVPFPEMLAEEVFPELEALRERQMDHLPEFEETFHLTEEPPHKAEVHFLPELEPEIEGLSEAEPEDLEDMHEEIPILELEEHVEEVEEVPPVVAPIEEYIEPVAEGPVQPMIEEPTPVEAHVSTLDKLSEEQQEAIINLQEGFEQYSRGEVKQALMLYDMSISKWPSFEAYWYKANALVEVGMPKIALATLDAALSMEPDRLEGWVSKAQLLLDLKEFDQANIAAMRARDLAPRSPAVKHIIERLMAAIAEALYGPPEEEEEEPAEIISIEEASPVADDEEVLDMLPIDEELAEIEEIELRSLRAKPEHVLAEGRGLVNGRGLTNGNGLVNGRALINGRGLVNGRSGLVNGMGLTNGNGLTNGAGRPTVPTKPVRRRRLRAIALALVLVSSVIAFPILMLMMEERPSMAMDGDLSDWSNVARFPDTLGDSGQNPDIDILQYAAILKEGSLFLLVETSEAGTMLGGRDLGVDVLWVFLECDGEPNTGYSIEGMGADRLIEVHGWDNQVRSTSLYTFDGNRNGKDWNGWQRSSGVVAAVGQHAMEARVSKQALDPRVGALPEILFLMMDSDSKEDLGDAIISTKDGALIVDVSESGPQVLTPGGPEEGIVSFRMRSIVEPATINSMALHFTGTHSSGLEGLRLVLDEGDGTPGPDDTELASSGPAGTPARLTLNEPFLVPTDQAVTLHVLVKIQPHAGPHTTFGITLPRTSIELDSGTVTVKGGPLPTKYIGSVPTRIHIDGAFDDWAAVPSNLDPLGDTQGAQRSEIDIVDYRSHFGTDAISFYLGTSGEMMSGMVVPLGGKVRPLPPMDMNITPPPPPFPPELPELTGADLALIYIDTDQDLTTGQKQSGIGADHLLQIEGKDGAIISSKLFRSVGGGTQWVEVPSHAPASNDRSRLEIQVNRASLGIDPYDRVDAFFIMTDWEDNFDVADSVLPGDRGQLLTKGIDVIPDTIRPGSTDAPILGIDLDASVEIVVIDLLFERMGNASDIATKDLYLFEDDGDRRFTSADTGTYLATSSFNMGRAPFILDRPLVIEGGTSSALFLAADLTFDGEDRTIGARLLRADIHSSAEHISGTFPISSLLATISTDSDRGTNNTVNLTDGLIDANWKQAREGKVKDGNDKFPGGIDIRESRLADNGTWLNFYTKTTSNLNTTIHTYIDTDGDGTADFDLVYDNDNATVRLFSYDGSNWTEVNITSSDRYDLVAKELEMGIEFSYLNLTANQTINYYMTSEDDPEPGGTVIDRGPDSGWSSNYTTIPEFSDLIIPLIGMMALFLFFRRARGRQMRIRSGNKANTT